MSDLSNTTILFNGVKRELWIMKGTYKNNAENRKLGRVGNKYGGAKASSKVHPSESELDQETREGTRKVPSKKKIDLDSAYDAVNIYNEIADEHGSLKHQLEQGRDEKGKDIESDSAEYKAKEKRFNALDKKVQKTNKLRSDLKKRGYLDGNGNWTDKYWSHSDEQTN